MSYQRAKLSVDANIEAYRKKVEAREAEEARQQEQEDMSIGEMIGGGIGFIVGGPGGMKAGQSIGRFAADEMSDAEDFFVTPGKFNRLETIDFNRELKEWDESNDLAHLVNLGTNAFDALKLSGAIKWEDGMLDIDWGTDITKWATKDGPRSTWDILRGMKEKSSWDWTEKFGDKAKSKSATEGYVPGLNMTPEYKEITDPMLINTMKSRDFGGFMLNDFTWNKKAQEIYGKNIAELTIQEQTDLTYKIWTNPQWSRSDWRDNPLKNWSAYGTSRYDNFLATLSEGDLRVKFQDIVGEKYNEGIFDVIEDTFGVDTDKFLALHLAESGGDWGATFENYPKVDELVDLEDLTSTWYR